MGLIIGFGIYRINFSFKDENSPISPTPTPENQAELTIAKPNNDDVVTSIPQTISGIATKSSWVIISNNSLDYFIKPDEKGVFEKEIDLIGGINHIIVSSIDAKGVTSSQNLRLIYSTQLQTPAPSNKEETSSESAVREAVIKKVEETLNSPKAYLGTVTDIAEKTIQLKTDWGTIEQVSTADEKIAVINQNATAKEIKITDIAIGDYIVAMGFRNGNHVLAAKRILITQMIPVPEIKIIYGKVKSISKKEIIINEGDKITITSKTKLSNKNIKEGNTVIATTRTIFLVESAP